MALLTQSIMCKIQFVASVVNGKPLMKLSNKKDVQNGEIVLTITNYMIRTTCLMNCDNIFECIRNWSTQI